MAPSFSFGLTAVSVACLAGSVAATGTLSMSIAKKAVGLDGLPSEHLDARGFYKRDADEAGTVSEQLFDAITWSNGGAYYTNVSVGTPPQIITVLLDTGSSDLYFDANNASACLPDNTGETGNCRGGTFAPNASSTYHVLSPGGFIASFGDNSSVGGDYSTDTFGIGGVQVANVQFGVAYSVNSTTGYATSLMGVGYNLIEGGVVNYNQKPYPNMPDVLQQAGVINSRLFSMYLNTLDAATGEILFGGVDTSKYTGELFTTNLLETPGGPSGVINQYLISMTGLGYNSSGKVTNLGLSPIPALMDSGTAGFLVGSDTYEELVKPLPAAIPDSEGTAWICSDVQNLDITYNVEFDHGITINVPVKEFFVQMYQQGSNVPLTTDKGEPVCTCMFTGASLVDEQGFLVVGDPILRSMYTVFDMDNAQLSLAQLNTNPGPSDVKVVKAGKDGVASAVGSGVTGAASNTVSGAKEATAVSSMTFSSVTSSVGQVSGLAALPEQAQPSGTPAGYSTGNAAASSASSTATGAASVGVPLPSFVGVGVAAVWLALTAVGMGFFLA